MTVTSHEISREDLMDLSLDAAIEIERAILGKSVNEAVIQQMIEAVGSTFRPNGGGRNAAHFIDPRVVAVYGRAANTVSTSQVRTVQAVKDWIAEFAQQYRASISNRGVSELHRLRDFFLALHRELAADVAPSRPETYLPGPGQNDFAKNTSLSD